MGLWNIFLFVLEKGQLYRGNSSICLLQCLTENIKRSSLQSRWSVAVFLSLLLAKQCVFKNSDIAAAAFYYKILLYVHKTLRQSELLIKVLVQGMWLLSLGHTTIPRELQRHMNFNPWQTCLCSGGMPTVNLEAGLEVPHFLKSHLPCICILWNLNLELLISQKCQKDSQWCLSMFVCLFFWKNCFVMFMWTAIDQNLFGKKLLCKKQREMLIVSSSGTKAAFKYLWIFYLNVWMNSSRLLGTLACLNNCQCSGRYPTKSGVWIANIWTAVLMEAWSTVEVAV